MSQELELELTYLARAIMTLQNFITRNCSKLKVHKTLRVL